MKSAEKTISEQKKAVRAGHITANVFITPEEKWQFEAILDDIGMNNSTAFTHFVKAVLRDAKMPFEMSLEER